MNHPCAFVVLLAGTLAGPLPAQSIVFQSDFDGTLPAAVAPGVAQLEGVQGYAGYGPPGAGFGGTFLRSPTGNAVTIQLGGLPPHNAIQLDFLFAAIDSLDGTGAFPSGDFFAIEIDGSTFFRESFANASPSQIQSYVPPPGVELARRIDLGFSGPGSYYTDSAYWLGGDPQFQGIGHDAATLTITMQVEGPGIQGLGDESWGMDNLIIRTLNVGNPGSVIAYGTSCGPTLSVLGTPQIGATSSVLQLNLPPTTLLPGMAVGLSDLAVGAAPLPLSLAFLGAPGCFLHHDAAIDFGAGMLLQGTAATASIAIPNDPAFAGFVFFLQGWGFAPGSNALGLVFSNGVRVQVGG